VRDPKPSVSIVPVGTDVLFCIISQSGSCRILGFYFRQVPAERCSRRRDQPGRSYLRVARMGSAAGSLRKR
jgi:hypothetical protein